MMLEKGLHFCTGIRLTPIILFVCHWISERATLLTIGHKQSSVNQRTVAARWHVSYPLRSENWSCLMESRTFRKDVNSSNVNVLSTSHEKGNIFGLVCFFPVKFNFHSTPEAKITVETQKWHRTCWSARRRRVEVMKNSFRRMTNQHLFRGKSLNGCCAIKLIFPW